MLHVDKMSMQLQETFLLFFSHYYVIYLKVGY